MKTAGGASYWYSLKKADTSKSKKSAGERSRRLSISYWYSLKITVQMLKKKADEADTIITAVLLP